MRSTPFSLATERRCTPAAEPGRGDCLPLPACCANRVRFLEVVQAIPVDEVLDEGGTDFLDPLPSVIEVLTDSLRTASRFLTPSVLGLPLRAASSFLTLPALVDGVPPVLRCVARSGLPLLLFRPGCAVQSVCLTVRCR